MKDTPDSIKIKMLAEAGYPPLPVQEKYLKLIEFVERVKAKSCSICCDDCLSCDALELLREMGEAE